METPLGSEATFASSYVHQKTPESCSGFFFVIYFAGEGRKMLFIIMVKLWRRWFSKRVFPSAIESHLDLEEDTPVTPKVRSYRVDPALSNLFPGSDERNKAKFDRRLY